MTTITLPNAERECLIKHYESAGVILEYGSGGSTHLAAMMPGKTIFSVESDQRWARNLQKEIDDASPPSRAMIYHVDIGPTGKWGRPLDDRSWRRYHHYPTVIWDEAFFQHPDVILIDGRFRTACFATALIKVTKPATVLFDDYTERSRYKVVERLASPEAIVGRMAIFKIFPQSMPREAFSFILSLFAQVKLAEDEA